MIQLLIVDDSALMRRSLTDLLSEEPEFRVIGAVRNGAEALERVRTSGPDVVLMDLEMPVMDGVEALKRIMAEWPLPVIIFSGTTPRDSERVLDAMEAGAVDFLVKPQGGFAAVREELFAKIRTAALARLRRSETCPARVHRFVPGSEKVIVIATSTGGPQTLERLLSELPGNLPVPVLVVQHMPPLFTKSFAERLDRLCAVAVREAAEGDPLVPGVVLIAPGGKHMELSLADGEPRITLNEEPPELGVRPCANRLFRSAASVFADRTIGVVLTGMGHDGTDGARAIRRHHGTILAEAEESCVIFGMPKEVIAAGLVDAVLPLEDLAVALVQLIDVWPGPA